MDSQKSLDTGEEVRMSPKLSSRRKRRRPVKFNQDFIMTDDLPQSSACLSPVEKQPYESTDNFMDTEPAEFLQSDDFSPSSSSRKIQRQVTSIRDVSFMKGSASKRVKVEDSGTQDSMKLEGSHGGQQTTFSSLLHTFASQVNSRVETNEHKSSYSESSAVPKAIWVDTKSRPSTRPNIQHKVNSDKSSQNQRASDSSSSNTRQDMSFSGMLQNFVSCVNDSSTSTKDTSIEQSSLKSLLTLKQDSVDRVRSTSGSPFMENRSTPVVKEQQSFAGLLHSFASVVDRGNQQSLQEKRHQLKSDQHHRSSPSMQEHSQKGSKSLLDVLHDTISRRVLENASSPKQDESHPQARFSQSSHNTQLDKVMQFNMDIPAQAKAPLTRLERRGGVEDFSSDKSFQARADRGEPEDELHPNSHQWSHIRNVLPPLDDTEEDAYNDQRHQSQSEGTLHHVQSIKTEPQDEEPSMESNYGQGVSEEQSQYLLSGAASLDVDDDEPESGHLQVTVKQEPVNGPSGSEWEMSGKDVNSTLRKRLLMRIGARQSIQSPSQSNSSTPSADTQLTPSIDPRSSTDLPGEPSSHKQPLQNQAGLVSNLLSTENSSHWRNKNTGSFADLLHNITSSMLEKDMIDDKREASQHKQISIKQELVMSDEEPRIESVRDYESAQEHLSSVSLTSLLQKERTGTSKDPNDKKKVPRCISRLHSNPSQSADSREFSFSDGKGTRAQKKKAVSYAEAPSLSSSPSLSSDDVDQNSILDVPPRTASKLINCFPTRAKHSNLMKHRWKRGPRYGLKIKQGWPSKRKDDLHQKCGEMRSVHVIHKPSSARRTDTRSYSVTSPAQKRSSETDTMSFTDILQKLAQKCQEGGPDLAFQGSFDQHSKQTSAASTHHQTDHSSLDRQQVDCREKSPSFHSDMLSTVPSSANLKNLLLQQSSPTRGHPEVEAPSSTPSTSGTSRDVSFSNIMQNMASTVTKKRGSSTVTEDLTSLEPPAPWVKSMSGNWLRFILIGPDENPRINMSVSVNLWNTIHEVKIHCHHLEVPANHWIFRRFGKRLHTKAALQGVLQAISNGCSVCEGTTRGDLVHMYRNKLASTTRWQAAALLEDSFGTATIRSSQCELLVSGLRRSREKRCSKCSKFVDRKLKAVMYHMKKKLGLS